MPDDRTPLARRLCPIALEARRRPGRLRRILKSALGTELLNRADLGAIAETAAFLAFVSAGGDPDHPDEFPWHKVDLVPLTKKKLLRLLVGGGSCYQAVYRQNRFRKREGQCNNEFRWDSWNENPPTIPEPLLVELPAILERSLDPMSLEVVRRRYWGGEDVQDIAASYGMPWFWAANILRYARADLRCILGERLGRAMLEAARA